jgi:hypothetical protein
VLSTERLAHLSYGRRLLRCGILTGLMTALGHPRHIGALSTLGDVRFASNTDRIDASH